MNKHIVKHIVNLKSHNSVVGLAGSMFHFWCSSPYDLTSPWGARGKGRVVRRACGWERELDTPFVPKDEG